MDDLQKISDLRHPANWFVFECRATELLSESFCVHENASMECFIPAVFYLIVSQILLYFVELTIFCSFSSLTSSFLKLSS